MVEICCMFAVCCISLSGYCELNAVFVDCCLAGYGSSTADPYSGYSTAGYGSSGADYGASAYAGYGSAAGYGQR